VRLKLGCCATAAALLLAGCGGGKKGPPDNGIAKMTPDQALAAAKKAVAGATSVHIYGSGKDGTNSLQLDLKLVKGEGGAGHFAANGLDFDVVRIAQKAYFRGDKAFWAHFTTSAAIQQRLAGKWIAAPANKGDFAPLAAITNLVQLADQTIAAPGPFEMGDKTEINGRQAIAINDTSDGATLYIATTGPAYPLKLTAGQGTSGTITFADWDQPVLLSAPAKAVDYAKLIGG
jgi:hypothetical protein